MKITPLSLNAIHQTDATLLVKQAETYELTPQSLETQYLNIEVTSSRAGVEKFIIRINAIDFKDLKDRVARTITIMPNVKFHQSVMDQFVDVFKETVRNNPPFDINQVSGTYKWCKYLIHSGAVNANCFNTVPPGIMCFFQEFIFSTFCNLLQIYFLTKQLKIIKMWTVKSTY